MKKWPESSDYDRIQFPVVGEPIDKLYALLSIRMNLCVRHVKQLGFREFTYEK